MYKKLSQEIRSLKKYILNSPYPDISKKYSPSMEKLILENFLRELPEHCLIYPTCPEQVMVELGKYTCRTEEHVYFEVDGYIIYVVLEEIFDIILSEDILNDNCTIKLGKIFARAFYQQEKYPEKKYLLR